MSLDFYLEGEDDEDGEPEELFWRNITHNLNTMAEEAGLYHNALWRPSYDRSQKAKDIIPNLEKGLDKLKADPEHFEQFNPANGWGDYEGLVRFTSAVLAACREHPEATVFRST